MPPPRPLAAALSLATALLPLPSFAQDIPATPADAALGTLLPFTARGNEPFWSLQVTRDGLQLALPEGKGTTEDHPFVDPSTDGAALIFTTDGYALRLEEGPCKDSMTGMPHPYRATLRRGAEDWAGCAGDPAALLQGDWQGITVDGTPVPEGIDITLTFDAGRLAAHTGCNRATGTATVTGEGLTLGPLATTRMACPPPRMEAERATLAALGQVTGFDIAPDGGLLLLGPDGQPRLSARR